MGLCSRGVLPLQDTWPHCGRWIYMHQLKSVDTMDSKSTRSPITTRAFKTHLSERIKGSPCTTWRHQMDAIHHNSAYHGWTRGSITMFQSKIGRLEFNRGPYKRDIVSKMGVRRGQKGSIRFSSNDHDSARSQNSTRATRGLICAGDGDRTTAIQCS